MRPALGMVMLWASYSLTLYGYCLLKGYDISFGQLLSPSAKWVAPSQYNKNTVGAHTWPPGPAPNTVLLPVGQVATVPVTPDGAVG